MNKIKDIFVALILIAGLFSSLSVSAETKKVFVCDDENFWPPYTFQEKGADGRVEVSGAMVELTKEIFQLADIPFKLVLTPWKRCLYQVENHSGLPAYEVFINGSYSDERAEKFLVSDIVYSAGAAYFYTTSKYPDGLVIDNLVDITNYKLCGVHGFNYDMYQVSSDDIAISAGDLHAAFQLLMSGRCELLLNAYSVPFGSKFTDKPMIDDSVRSGLIESIPSQTFHMFVSRKSSRGESLLKTINTSIEQLKASGRTETIFRKYLPDCGAEC